MSDYDVLRAALPPYTADPLDRLKHTLAALGTRHPDNHVLTATSYTEPFGRREWTGLTMGDLQDLARELRELRAAPADPGTPRDEGGPQ